MNRISYRVCQFWAAFHGAQFNNEDLDLVKSILTTRQLELFDKFQTSEKAHSLKVLKSLLDNGETNPDLLTAALLHDIGKIKHPLQPLERAIAVLGKLLFPVKSIKWGRSHPIGFVRPFVVAQNHPGWGADLADLAGASALTVTLIRNHETDIKTSNLKPLENRLLEALKRADNHN